MKIPDDAQLVPVNPESPEELLRRLLALEFHEEAVQSLNRQEMLRDHQYYDGQQWERKDAAALLERGQAPVAYNQIKPRVDWATGTQRRARVDGKVLPRGKDPRMADDARLKTDILKYLSDANDQEEKVSEAFKQSVISGLSWLEVGINHDPDKELLAFRKEDWWSVLHDSSATELDGSDMRYLFRRRTVDLDMALAHFPKQAEALRRAAEGGAESVGSGRYYLGTALDEIDLDLDPFVSSRYVSFDANAWRRSTRKRVTLRECWHFAPVRMVSAQMAGQNIDRVKMGLFLTIFVEGQILLTGPSPYRHNRIPFHPVYCYRRAIDNMPYGMVRQQRDAQDSHNKRMSKSLFAMSSDKLFIEDGAVDPNLMTLDRIREEISKPNAVIKMAVGAVSGKKFQIESGQALAASHLQFAAQDAAFIANTFGVNNENLGLQTNASSGVAIQKRQNEGTVSTTEPFDNLHAALRRAGIMILAVVEQFYTEPRAFRIAGQSQPIEWREINTIDPDTGEPVNDITEFAADFVMDQVPWQASLAQGAMLEFWDLMQKIAPVDPQIVRMLLDMLVEFSPSLPGKAEILKRIRQATGMTDPSSPETPEEAQKRAAAEQEQAAAAQLQAEEIKLKLEGMKAENKLTDAKAVEMLMKAFYSSMQGAQVNAMSPGIAPVADSMLASAGFQDQDGQDPNIPPGQGQPAGPEQVQVQGQPMPDGAPPPLDQPMAADGVNAGIQTQEADGIPPPVQQ